MAKAGTTRKKPAASKRGAKQASPAARTGGRSTSKSTSHKTSANSKATKEKMSKKKTASKKKVATRVAKKSTSKATSKPKTKTTKKKSSKKPVTKKQATAGKKETSTKKSKAADSKVSAKATATGEAGSEASPKKKVVRKKRLSAADARKRGRSVAEVASAAEADAQGYVFINGRRVRMISTAGKVINKKSKAAAVEPVAEEETPVKLLKTKLTKKQLNHYRDLLLIKRAEIVGDLSAMEAAALRSSGGELSHMPIHMADIGSDTYEQDFTLGLAESERRQLREIDDALARIEDRTYGVCQMTGKDIPKARLDAKPWAKYTIEAARIVESQMQR